jgi:uncharacterized pyridoxamine 5'-phosphate oxidase family protein
VTKEEIYAFITANPVCFLATVDGDRPHVRGMMIYRADADGIVFHSGKMKDLHRQLTANPAVEFCFSNGDMNDLLQVRVSGTARLVEDLDLKKEIVEQRPFLKGFVAQAGYEPLSVYRVSDGVAVTWSFATNLAPKAPVNL